MPEINNKPPIEHSDQNKPPLSRRMFLSLGAAGVAGSGIIASDIISRRADVEEKGKFLRGVKENATVNIFGEKLTLESLISKLSNLSKPPLRLEETADMLDSFSYMIEIEDKFGMPFNTMSTLEVVDQVKEKITKRGPDFASSFGYGQINPQTAMRLVMDRLHIFKELWPKLGEKLEAIKGKPVGTVSDLQIIKLLDLRGDGNIVPSYLAFTEVYNLYGRGTGGQVHGGLRFPDTRGEIHSRRQDPRGFSLAVAAYSGTPMGPMVAKAQCYINEIRLARKDLNFSPLNIDGSLGKNTLKEMQTIFTDFGLNFPSDLNPEQLKNMSAQKVLEKKLVALDDWLNKIRPTWKNIFQKSNIDPSELKEIVAGRYSLVMRMRKILLTLNIDFSNKEALEKRGDKVSTFFDAYIENRDPNFLKLIADEEFFKKIFPEINHHLFLRWVYRGIEEKVFGFDELYKGVIPTAYRKGGAFGLADSQNIMKRVTLGHELDLDSPVAIPIDTKEKRKKKKLP